MARKPADPAPKASTAAARRAAASAKTAADIAAETAALTAKSKEGKPETERPPRTEVREDSPEAAAEARAAASAAFAKRPTLVLDGAVAASERTAALPLADYLSVLRREIARAGIESAEEVDLPLISLSEAEISLTCVAVAIENDRLIVDPSWKALSSAPEAAIQRMTVRMVDADINVALKRKT